MTEISTYSSWKTFRNCRKKFWWRYVQDLVPIERDNNLVFGQLVHLALKTWHETRSLDRALDAVDGGTPDRATDPQQRRNRLVATAMITAYARIWRDEPFEVVALEKRFQGPIRNPETGAESRTFFLAGRVDGIVRQDGDLWIPEHKTTSVLDSGYLEKLWTDFQIILYRKYVQEMLGVHVAGVIYNILVKPQIRQYEPGKVRQVAETDEEFGARLLEWCLQPGKFHREALLVDAGQTRQIEAELWELTQSYLDARRRNAWYMNTDHCFVYNRACPYFRLCRSGDNPTIRENYYRVEPPHEELRDDPVEETVF